MYEALSAISLSKRTDKNAWIKWAFTTESGFPFIKIVNVSSFSVVIKLPNQDFLVSSGDDSGVRWTSSDETVERSKTQIHLSPFLVSIVMSLLTLHFSTMKFGTT